MEQTGKQSGFRGSSIQADEKGDRVAHLGVRVAVRIVFDLDQTLMGLRHDGRLMLNRRLLGVAQKLRRDGNTLILWTFGNRKWWRKAASMFPVLREVFQEIYSRDELPGRVTQGRGFPEPVKDIRLIQGDVLIDNDPAHIEWARRHGMAGQYIQVPSFGEA